MRIDKFLWCVRKFKTRSLASEVVKKERVLLNEELVKASRTVKVGDKVSIKKDGALLSYQVLDIPKSRLGAKLVENYVKDVTDPDQLEKLEFIQMMKNLSRKKGTGRPTKKERRDIDDMLSDE
jgi:ribosome-associated heat shock protein Hsp15